MKGFAYAKINLHLHITDRADNGYHLLDSLVAFTSLHDELRIKTSEHFQLDIKGNIGLLDDCPQDDNLVTRACHFLAQHAGIPPNADIELFKNIPLAAGLGGGSADAAITLLMLRNVWHIDVSDNDLHLLASQLGSDIAACLKQKPVILRGTGNHLLPAPQLPSFHVLLINPNVACSTPQVYKDYEQSKHSFSNEIMFPDAFTTIKELCDFLNQHTHNDLTAAAIQNAPIIEQVLKEMNALPNQLLTRLSGSGATCFSIFENETDAQAAARQIEKAHPEWWTFAGNTTNH